MSQVLPLLAIWLLFGVGVVVASTSIFLPATDTRQTQWAVWLTAWIACGFWFLAMAGLLRQKPGDINLRPFRQASWPGLIMLVIHTLISFHGVHHWSWREAYEFTERVGGWGGGLFINFLIIALWGVDLLATNQYPSRLRQRMLRVNRLGIAFVMFQATVVFAHTPMRWLALLAFAWLGWHLLNRRQGTAMGKDGNEKPPGLAGGSRSPN